MELSGAETKLKTSNSFTPFLFSFKQAKKKKFLQDV